MLKRILIAILLPILSVLSILVVHSTVSAEDVVQTETCNVTVTFKATVPSSVEQGKSFTITNISVQPKSSYGFTVASSVFDMTATNTSSATYSQNFITTDPSPTTGHNTYQGIYPNWSLNASGAVGSNIVIKLKKTVTVVQGYGNVTCSFTKTLATIPITAPPAPSPSPSSSPSPSPSPSNNPSDGGSSGGSSNNSSGSSSSKSDTNKNDGKKTGNSDSKGEDKDSTDTSTNQEAPGISVVPIVIEVTDDSGKKVEGAEVTLDGEHKVKTDSKGLATFPNILTGDHSLVVTYAGQKVSKKINVNTLDVGAKVPVKLPPVDKSTTVIIIASILGALLAGGIGTVALMMKRRRNAEAALAATTHMSLSNIRSGSAVPVPVSRVPAATPAILMYDTKPTPRSLAPWDLPTVQQPAPSSPPAVPLPTPVQQSIPLANPIQPASTATVPAPITQPTPAQTAPVTIPVQQAPQTAIAQPQPLQQTTTPAPVAQPAAPATPVNEIRRF